MRFRFFDTALMKLKLQSVPGLRGYVCDGESLSYDPLKLLTDYKEEPNIAVRLYLHVMLHAIFMHPYRYDKTDENFWNIATDIAVENIILEMDIPGASMMKDDEERMIITRLRKWVPEITAEKLYREFAVGGISHDAEIKYKQLFTMDRHRVRASYKEEPEAILTEEDWKKIAERVKAELDSFPRRVWAARALPRTLRKPPKLDMITTRYSEDFRLRAKKSRLILTNSTIYIILMD